MINVSSVVREQLAVANLKPDRFREIVGRLFAYGVLVREEDRTEQALYDDARRIQTLLEDYFGVAGFFLRHDETNLFFRLYAPGAVIDGVAPDNAEPVPSLRARLSPDFVAAALGLRLLYERGLGGGDLSGQGEVVISLEDLASVMQDQLKRPLPAAAGEKFALLADLRRHRLLRYSATFSLTDEDAYLAIRPTILSVINNDAVQAALDADGRMEVDPPVAEADPA